MSDHANKDDIGVERIAEPIIEESQEKIIVNERPQK